MACLVVSGPLSAQPVAEETEAAPSSGVMPSSEATTPAPSIVLTDLRLDPPSPPPATLCRLWVTLRNDGHRPASLLHFRVRINGQTLQTYEDDTFVVHLAAGEEQEIRLFNFWSSETGRPPSSDGRLEIEVVLEEATWIEIKDGGDPLGSLAGASQTVADPEEEWIPRGSVPGLPSALRRVLGAPPQ